MATEATTQAKTETTQEDNKVTFTEAQQKRIDEIVRESMGRAGREAKTEAEQLNSRVQTMQAELESAKAELVKAKTPGEKRDAKAEADGLNAQIAEMKAIQAQTAAEMDRLKQLAASKDKDVETARGEALNVRKQVAIQSAASAQGFVDVDVVTALTQNQIQYDNQKGRFVVTGENGQAKLNSAYEPMSLEEFFADYASKKPYLVRGDVKAGVGSTEAQRSGLANNGKYGVEDIFGPKSDAIKANNLAKTDIKEYQRLKKIAKEAKIISW